MDCLPAKPFWHTACYFMRMIKKATKSVLEAASRQKPFTQCQHPLITVVKTEILAINNIIIYLWLINK